MKNYVSPAAYYVWNGVWNGGSAVSVAYSGDLAYIHGGYVSRFGTQTISQQQLDSDINQFGLPNGRMMSYSVLNSTGYWYDDSDVYYVTVSNLTRLPDSYGYVCNLNQTFQSQYDSAFQKLGDQWQIAFYRALGNHINPTNDQFMQAQNAAGPSPEQAEPPKNMIVLQSLNQTEANMQCVKVGHQDTTPPSSILLYVPQGCWGCPYTQQVAGPEPAVNWAWFSNATFHHPNHHWNVTLTIYAENDNTTALYWSTQLFVWALTPFAICLLLKRNEHRKK